jgi:hypothetical protein
MKDVCNMTKRLIFGNGFIGNRLDNFIEDSTISYRRINTIDDIFNQIKEYNPEVFINRVGKTGIPNVDEF